MFEEEVNKSICQLDACIYVQCFNYPAIDECCWAINFAKSNDNIVRGVVAEIPLYLKELKPLRRSCKRSKLVVVSRHYQGS